MPSRPRDSQRSKVYAAEGVLGDVPASPLWLVTVGRFRPPTPTLAQVQGYVDLLLEQRWFQSRWGQRQINVSTGRGARGFYHAGISIPSWARRETVILHEVAHTLDPSHSHGPTYTGILITLVRFTLGTSAARLLRDSFRAHRVRVSMAQVPKVDASRVVTKVVAAERKVAPVQRSSVDAAAKVLRRLVAQGHFGPSGRKPRDHALEVTRRLEEMVRVSAGWIDQDSLTEVVRAAKKRP